MKTLAIWYYITFGYNGTIYWSPPLPTVEECQRIQQVINPSNPDRHGRCIQIIEVVK